MKRSTKDGCIFQRRMGLAHVLYAPGFEHQPANTPYRSTHASYVRKVADRAFEAVDSVPEVLASRLLAIRAFDAQHMMIDDEVCEDT